MPGPEQVATNCFSHLSPAHSDRDEAECPVGKGSLGLNPALPLTHSVLLGKVLTSVPLSCERGMNSKNK